MLDSKIRIPEDVLFREIEGETVLLHQKTGKYFSLDAVGTRMWILLVEHGEVTPVYRTLLDEYDVTPEQLERDLLILIDELASHELLHVDPA